MRASFSAVYSITKQLPGCTHKSDFVLWANGSFVSPGVRVFVENGKPQLLIEELEVVEDKVWRWFQAAKIPSGEGNTTTIITMEPSHPFVSIIVRIVPSPDWFVGVSSLNLCENGKWRTRKLFDLFPWDAGTDSGFTFSSPNFETQPQEAVSQITAMTPSHPANSFYYPRIKKLPRLGFLEFSLLAAETNKATQNGTESPPVNSEQILEECILDGDATHHKNATESRQQKGNNTDEEFKSSESFTLKQHCGKSQTTTPLDCEVSQWSSWGLCSHFCGNGSRQRTRYITLKPANGGDPCPTLMEKEPCQEVPCPTDSPTTSERPSTTPVPSKKITTPLDCEVSPWSSWGLCSHFCGSGIRQRTRYITLQPANGGDSCPTLMEKEPCQAAPCSTDSPATSERPFMTPVPSKNITTLLDCEVSQWSSWGLCSHFCGNGSRQRTRYITLKPVNGGNPCPTVKEKEPCQKAPCPTDSPTTSERPGTTPAPSKKITTPLDCELSQWSSWGLCSHFCGNGIRQRTRYITIQPANDGNQCPTLMEKEPCHKAPCSTDSPAISERPSMTPAPSKKIFNLKWIPSQETRGALWKSIYHRLLSRTKGFKNTTTYLHSVPTHSNKETINSS
ncbi:spondin-1-like isoform X2 [Lissotriton helveticus]